MSSPPAETRRLFFALWPDPGLQQRLHHLARQVARPGGGRLVPQQNLHITLAFLGSIDAKRQQCLEDVAGSIHIPAFSLTLDRAGYWERPRVIWFGCSDTPTPLQTLARELAVAMERCGLQPERRPFAAHLTVMRKALHGPADREIPPLDWPVSSFALVESLTLPAGAQYRVIRCWSLSPVEDRQG